MCSLPVFSRYTTAVSRIGLFAPEAQLQCPRLKAGKSKEVSQICSSCMFPTFKRHSLVERPRVRRLQLVDCDCSLRFQQISEDWLNCNLGQHFAASRPRLDSGTGTHTLVVVGRQDAVDPQRLAIEAACRLRAISEPSASGPSPPSRSAWLGSRQFLPCPGGMAFKLSS